MNGSIMPDILKVLRNGLGNRNLHQRDAEALHQVNGIIVGTVGGSKAGHSHAHDPFAVHLQFVEGLHANEQSQRGIESTADTHNHFLGMGVLNALGQSHHLNAENLLTRLLHVSRLRNEGMRIYLTNQLEVTRLNAVGIDNLCRIGMLRIHIGTISASLRTEFLHVNLRDHHLGFH